MFMERLSRFLSVFHLSTLALAILPRPGSLQKISNATFNNPTNAGFYIYIPKNLAPKPAALVAIHYCTGTGDAFYKNTRYGQLSETYGYIIIYPSSPNDGTCWDVSSKASLSNTEKGDSGSIVGMVKWTLKNYPAIDSQKVFLLGESSGAMMTNVLAAAYPSLFSAAIVYAGVPAGCFAASNPTGIDWWNSTCSTGKSIATPQKWASIAKAMGPTNYKGSRPKMLIYHGAKDATLNPLLFEEEVKQWSGVFAYDYQKPISKVEAKPAAQHITTVWGPLLKGVLGANEPHSLSMFPDMDMEWFGFK